MGQTLNKSDIEKLIPHRAPILLVDEVTDWESDSWLEATRYFPENDPCFNGHFPGNPILPGVLAVEAMAQSAAILTSLTRNVNAENSYYLFVGIEKCRFKNPVIPGQKLTMRVTKVRDRMDIYEFEGKALIDGKVAANATFIAKLMHE
jgi:3-hydroxyacyl-[acyl-carrier-protein] dehydratase